MFKKSQKLSRSEFSKYFKKGKRRHFPHATLITHQSPTTKVSVVVGKKVNKSAIKRNLYKRRVYAQLKDLLRNEKPVVMIVLLKPSFANLTRKDSMSFVGEMVAQVIKNK